MLLDACVVSLTGDVTGTGKCAGKALGALGAGGRRLGGCSARDAIPSTRRPAFVRHDGDTAADLARAFA